MQRLWIGDEDYGTASDYVANLWLGYARERGDDARTETVPDDAPVFLGGVDR